MYMFNLQRQVINGQSFHSYVVNSFMCLQQECVSDDMLFQAYNNYLLLVGQAAR